MHLISALPSVRLTKVDEMLCRQILRGALRQPSSRNIVSRDSDVEVHTRVRFRQDAFR
jgi:hypothetical protein